MSKTAHKASTKSLTVGVTGATGFVGRATVSALNAAGHTPIALVRRTSKERNNDIEQRETGAIETTQNWDDLIEGCDAVIHLAAKVHIRDESFNAGVRGLFDPVNVGATYRLARACAKAGTHLVFVSSSKVYGEHNKTDWHGRFKPFTETDPLQPHNAYAHSKAGADTLLQMMVVNFDLALTIVRPPLMYGAGVGANFAALIEAVNAGKTLPFAGVKNARSLLSVNNLAAALVQIVQNPKAYGHTFNVTDTTPLSTPNLIRHIAQALEKPSHLVNIPPLFLNIGSQLVFKHALYQKLCANMVLENAKITKELNWTPPFETPSEIRNTVLAHLSSTIHQP